MKEIFWEKRAQSLENITSGGTGLAISFTSGQTDPPVSAIPHSRQTDWSPESRGFRKLPLPTGGRTAEPSATLQILQHLGSSGMEQMEFWALGVWMWMLPTDSLACGF